MKPHHWIIISFLALLSDLFLASRKGSLALGLAGGAMAGIVLLGFPELLEPQLAIFACLFAVIYWFCHRYPTRAAQLQARDPKG